MRKAAALVGVALILVPRLLAGGAEETPVPAPATAERPAFPGAWEGRWRGEARSVPRRGPIREFAMELEVRPLEDGSGHSWTIVYAEGERRQVRPYEIHAVDEASGHWRIDEKNSILIDAFLVEDALHSRFEVLGSTIDVRYALRDGAIDVVLTTYAAAPLTESGGRDRIPAVASHALRAVQTARLVRVD